MPFPSKSSQKQLSIVHNRSVLNRSNVLNANKPSPISLLPQQKRQFSEAAAKQPRMQTFSVYRWDPNGTEAPKEVDYQVDISDCPMILDVLIKIKNQQDTVQSLITIQTIQSLRTFAANPSPSLFTNIPSNIPSNTQNTEYIDIIFPSIMS